MNGDIWLVRHGETEWTVSGAHTGKTDVPLTPKGERMGLKIGSLLRNRPFALVLTSPLIRARETCRLAGYGEAAITDENLVEWDYGDYEGRTTEDIRREHPGWSLWVHGTAGGETISDVANRARAVIDRCSIPSGPALLFAHGHFLRVLAACWLGLEPQSGRLFALSTASLSILGFERETRVVRLWNHSVESEI
jgi:probable phosphoglycerate mutase